MNAAFHYLVVDDEELSRLYVSDLLEASAPSGYRLSLASSAKQARQILNDTSVDVVFLDIEMPTEDGFQWLDSVRTQRNFQLVFLTGHHEYALRAIKEQPIDYLLKPLDKQEFAQVIQRLQPHPVLPRQVPSPSGKMMLNYQGGFRLVDVADVLLLKADDNYTRVELHSGEHLLITKSLAEFERKLDPHLFFRVHKSYMVNLGHLQGFTSEDGGHVVLTGNRQVPVSRYRLNDLMRVLEVYTGGLRA